VADRNESPVARSAADRVQETIEEADDDSNSDDSESQYEDPLETFYKKVGYLPPLDDAALELLEIVSPDPELVAIMGRLSASKDIVRFQRGLLVYRNVSLKPSHDISLKDVKSLPWTVEKEDPAEEAYNNRLWELDRAKCSEQSNEPTFQRTILISMIDRYRLIYNKGDADKALLDFAVEGTWTCPPMPTRAFRKSENFLTKPRPDLAIAFRRQSLFPQGTGWQMFPLATQRLIFYEGTGESQLDRCFHFFTVEAKKPDINVTDKVALAQSLNSASQALHNMYEFFKEADGEEGDEYVNIFYKRVRFFSVVATSEGIKIRIHRASCIGSGIQQDLDNPILEGYPLKFEYDDYWTASNPLLRQDVVDVFGQILYGYGVNELAGHLQRAITKIDQKFKNYEKDNRHPLQRDDNYYSYGQIPPLSRATTAASPRRPSQSQQPPSFQQLNISSTTTSFAHNAVIEPYSGHNVANQADSGKKRQRTG
jgi:hypothetical protein